MVVNLFMTVYGFKKKGSAEGVLISCFRLQS